MDPASGAFSVGVPVNNTVVRILDEEGAPVPLGEIGEICADGPQVVLGYWGKPEETRHALPDRVLHSGDVGFMTPEGWVFIVDRKKDMINASGYKVWPREVEDVLYEHPAVREAAVVGVPDEYRGETVKAFVSLRPGATVEVEELIAFCKERMSAYKYPRQIELRDELRQPVGLLHGGVLSTLVESICSRATALTVMDAGMMAMGQSISVNFIRPVTAGGAEVKARARHRGRTTWVWDAEVLNDEGKLCALAQMTIAVRPIPER